MLDDDGRYIESGCVPYAISQASGLAIEHVIAVCRTHGWSEVDGMRSDEAVLASAELGFDLVQEALPYVRGKLTLRRLQDVFLRTSEAYIVATRDHWHAVVRGESRDPACTHRRALVHALWVVRAA